jgi:hypothetical protein
LRVARALGVCGLLACAAGGPLGAQGRSALDVGLAVVRFPEESSTVAGPSVTWIASREWRRLFASINAGGVGTLGTASGSATFAGGARRPFARRWLAEGGAELFGAAGSGRRSTTSGQLAGRLIRVIGGGGAWARASVARADRQAGILPASGVDAGAWWGWSRGRVTAAVTDQHATAQLFGGVTRETLLGTLPVHYVEGALGAHLEGDVVALDVSAGVRRDPDAAGTYEPVFAATAAFWQGPAHAWTLTVARQAPDWVRGADAAQWIAVGMRFFEPSPALVRASRARPIVQLSGTGARRLLRVQATGARRVELMADFTDWASVDLKRAGGGFERDVELSAGTHRMLVRIDGGAWRPAANTPAVDDDLGGRAGLLVVP